VLLVGAAIRRVGFAVFLFLLQGDEMSLMDALKGKADTVIGSASGLRSVGVDILEQATNNTLENYNYYSGVGIRQLRALTTVSDLGSARKFLTNSVTLGGELFKHAMDNLQKNIAIGTAARASVSEVFGSVANATQASDEPAPRAAQSKAAKAGA